MLFNLSLSLRDLLARLFGLIEQFLKRSERLAVRSVQGQLVAVHPAYDEAFSGFAPPSVRGNPRARQEWAVDQLRKAASASQRLGLNAHATFSGALAWPYLYPWPQRPASIRRC